MKKLIYFIFILAALISIQGCAPSRFVRPLKKGENAITSNYGGAMIKVFNMTIPSAYTSLGYGRGLTDKLTAFGSMHTTALLFGVIQAELGASYAFLQTDSLKPFVPGISGSLYTNITRDIWMKEARLWPGIDLNAYWEYGEKNNYFYCGSSNWLELSKYKAHNEVQQNHLIWNFQAGNVFSGKKWDFITEMKFLALNKDNNNIVVDYVKPFGKKGTVGLYFGLTRRF